MIVVFWRLEPAFANARNMFSILQAVSVTALLALGVTVTLAIAGFDLSIGSTAAMSLMASSYAMVILNQGTVVAVVACLLLGLLIGYLNGVLIVYGRIPDLLATLGMMFLLLGLQLISTGGRSIAKGMTLGDGVAATGTFTDAFLALGRYHVFNLIPLPVIVTMVAAIILWVFMERSRFGRVLYAIGGERTSDPPRRRAGQTLQDRGLHDFRPLLGRRHPLVGPRWTRRRDVRFVPPARFRRRGADRLRGARRRKKPNVFGTAIGAVSSASCSMASPCSTRPCTRPGLRQGARPRFHAFFTFGFASSQRR